MEPFFSKIADEVSRELAGPNLERRNEQLGVWLRSILSRETFEEEFESAKAFQSYLDNRFIESADQSNPVIRPLCKSIVTEVVKIIDQARSDLISYRVGTFNPPNVDKVFQTYFIGRPLKSVANQEILSLPETFPLLLPVSTPIEIFRKMLIRCDIQAADIIFREQNKIIIGLLATDISKLFGISLPKRDILELIKEVGETNHPAHIADHKLMQRLSRIVHLQDKNEEHVATLHSSIGIVPLLMATESDFEAMLNGTYSASKKCLSISQPAATEAQILLSHLFPVDKIPESLLTPQFNQTYKAFLRNIGSSGTTLELVSLLKLVTELTYEDLLELVRQPGEHEAKCFIERCIYRDKKHLEQNPEFLKGYSSAHERISFILKSSQIHTKSERALQELFKNKDRIVVLGAEAAVRNVLEEWVAIGWPSSQTRPEIVEQLFEAVRYYQIPLHTIINESIKATHQDTEELYERLINPKENSPLDTFFDEVVQSNNQQTVQSEGQRQNDTQYRLLVMRTDETASKPSEFEKSLSSLKSQAKVRILRCLKKAEEKKILQSPRTITSIDGITFGEIRILGSSGLRIFYYKPGTNGGNDVLLLGIFDKSSSLQQQDVMLRTIADKIQQLKTNPNKYSLIEFKTEV
jgi:hypothetical protein